MSGIKLVSLEKGIIEGSTYKCTLCGYRKEISPTYPDRKKGMIKADEHNCKGD